MKRSEAKRLLANQFYEWNLEPEEADEEAEKFLQKLESKLVPTDFSICFQWEKEDEMP